MFRKQLTRGRATGAAVTLNLFLLLSCSAPPAQNSTNASAQAAQTPQQAAPTQQAATPGATPSQEAAPKEGDINITPITHASVQLEYGGKVIHVDPWGQGDYSAAKQADLVLVTDIHQDHLDPAAIARVRKAGAPVVAPAAAAAKIENATVMKNGETKEVAGVSIEAVPMYNLQRGPEPGKLFHDKGRGNGYILSLGGKRVYIAGDTECTPEMRALKNIDIAFIPMNLPYTMPPSEAAECVKAFKPKVVYPYHYRGQNPEEFKAALKGEAVEVRLLDWYKGQPAGGAK
ncbi:MAG TPA: MBL fold metallo-hydrolase [Pyrinomonadaceae bacterium]|nr:MBL fold metallo-hydrolase [Pyrinomonadaceae bacterium]